MTADTVARAAPETAPPRALPAALYTEPDTHARVLERILWPAWHHACHTSQVPGPGDYLAFTLLGQDLFVVRGRDGGLRCFYNVCQHRGHPLVAGTGRTRVLVCPYHAWAYELDGRLRAAPGAPGVSGASGASGARAAGLDAAGICLTEVRVDVFLGFVFVCLDPATPPMQALFPGVAEAVRARCPDIETRVFAHEHSAEEHCNWLVAVENYNECYHCGHCHRSFSDGVVDPASYDIQPFGPGRVLRHTAGAARGEGAWYDTGAEPPAGPGGTAYASFYLFPAFSLQLYPGGIANTYHWRPLGHDNTRVHRGWLSADGVVDDRLQTVIDLDRETTFAEDLALVRAVQRGLGSRGYRPGPLVIAQGGAGIASEHSIAALQGWVAEALA